MSLVYISSVHRSLTVELMQLWDQLGLDADQRTATLGGSTAALTVSSPASNAQLERVLEDLRTTISAAKETGGSVKETGKSFGRSVLKYSSRPSSGAPLRSVTNGSATSVNVAMLPPRPYSSLEAAASTPPITSSDVPRATSQTANPKAAAAPAPLFGLSPAERSRPRPLANAATTQLPDVPERRLMFDTSGFVSPSHRPPSAAGGPHSTSSVLSFSGGPSPSTPQSHLAAGAGSAVGNHARPPSGGLSPLRNSTTGHPVGGGLPTASPYHASHSAMHQQNRTRLVLPAATTPSDGAANADHQRSVSSLSQRSAAGYLMQDMPSPMVAPPPASSSATPMKGAAQPPAAAAGVFSLRLDIKRSRALHCIQQCVGHAVSERHVRRAHTEAVFRTIHAVEAAARDKALCRALFERQKMYLEHCRSTILLEEREVEVAREQRAVDDAQHNQQSVPTKQLQQPSGDSAEAQAQEDAPISLHAAEDTSSPEVSPSRSGAADSKALKILFRDAMTGHYQVESTQRAEFATLQNEYAFFTRHFAKTVPIVNSETTQRGHIALDESRQRIYWTTMARDERATLQQAESAKKSEPLKKLSENEFVGRRQFEDDELLLRCGLLTQEWERLQIVKAALFDMLSVLRDRSYAAQWSPLFEVTNNEIHQRRQILVEEAIDAREGVARGLVFDPEAAHRFLLIASEATGFQHIAESSFLGQNVSFDALERAVATRQQDTAATKIQAAERGRSAKASVSLQKKSKTTGSHHRRRNSTLDSGSSTTAGPSTAGEEDDVAQEQRFAVTAVQRAARKMLAKVRGDRSRAARKDLGRGVDTEGERQFAAALIARNMRHQQAKSGRSPVPSVLQAQETAEERRRQKQRDADALEAAARRQELDHETARERALGAL